ncbi:MAG: hypothetical protein ACO1OQ_01005 [Rufibacter sp.]
MKIFLVATFLVILTLFSSCTRENAAQYETAPTAEAVAATVTSPRQASFKEFTQELPVLTLPFTATCSFDFAKAAPIDTAAARNFLQAHEVPYRQLKVSTNVTAVITLFPADETLPRIRAFSQDGTVLDEQDLKFNPCREEPGYAHREQFTIQKDLTIVHIDSTTRWEYDAHYNEVPNTRKLTVTRKRFKINPAGQILVLK